MSWEKRLIREEYKDQTPLLQNLMRNEGKQRKSTVPQAEGEKKEGENLLI